MDVCPVHYKWILPSRVQCQHRLIYFGISLHLCPCRPLPVTKSVSLLHCQLCPSLCHSVRLSVTLSDSPSLCPTLRHSARLSVTLSVSPSLCPSLRHSAVSPSLCPSLRHSVRLYVTPSLCPSLRHSAHLSVTLSVSPSLCQSLRHSAHLSICLSLMMLLFFLLSK